LNALTALFSICVTISCTLFVLRVSRNPINQIVVTLFTVNFILGHIILLSFQLITKASNPVLLGDPRLFDPSISLVSILFLNALQYFCVMSGYVLVQKFWKNKKTSIQALPQSINRALIAMVIIGWTGNISILLGEVNLFSAFHPFELLGTLWIVSGFRLKDMHIFYPILFGASHFIWAMFFFHSKAEVFVIFIAILIRFLHYNRKIIRIKILVLISLTISLFPLIQNQKKIFTATKAYDLISQSGGDYPAVRSFIIGILERFDGANSITDAYLAGPGSWFQVSDYGRILLSKFIPNVSFLVGEYFGENTRESRSLGQLWNNELRSQTFGNVTRDVPVSYGPFAEGYAISGLTLAILLSISFGILISKLCDLNYTKNLLSITCGLYFVSNLVVLQNSTGSLFLMLPKALLCFTLLYILKIFFSFETRKSN